MLNKLFLCPFKSLALLGYTGHTVTPVTQVTWVAQVTGVAQVTRVKQVTLAGLSLGYKIRKKSNFGPMH